MNTGDLALAKIAAVQLQLPELDWYLQAFNEGDGPDSLMLVTSDIFDLKAIGCFQGFEWQENLLCGVAVHGTGWRGYQADASCFLDAAGRRGLLAEMKYASYDRRSEKRQHFIKPSSFERLARGELAGAKGAD